MATDLRKLAEAATPGPWDTDSIDNEDGRDGFKSYAVGCGPTDKWKVVCDTLNSDLIEVESDYDVDSSSHWDEVGRRNAEYIAAANPKAILALLDASAAKDAEIARLREALSAACGYMRNAAIDLGTGAPKKTALATVEGGLKLAEAALKEASHG